MSFVSRITKKNAASIGIATSLLTHALVVSGLLSTSQRPDMGFSFQLPTEIEFGVVNGGEAQQAKRAPQETAEPPAEEAPTPAAQATGESFGGDASVPVDASASDASTSDGGASDAGRRRRRTDGGTGSSNSNANSAVGTSNHFAGQGSVMVPDGGFVALWLDFGRIRETPVAGELVALLAQIPDWQHLLLGSDVDPLRDFSRVYIMSPTLTRDTTVIAGKLTEESPSPRDVTQRMAASNGLPLPEWADRNGLPSALWPNLDTTERYISLLGPRHFIVARQSDVDAVLASASIVATQTNDDAGVPEGTPPTSSVVEEAEQLLALRDGELFAAQIENVQRYIARSPCPIPMRIRVHASANGQESATVRVEMWFHDVAQAGTATQCFEQLRDQQASWMETRLPFSLFAGHVRGIRMSQSQTRMNIQATMPFGQAKMLLGAAPMMIAPYLGPQVQRPTPPASATPSAGQTP